VLSSLRLEVRGRLARSLQERVARDAENLLCQLLVEATRLWERENFFRWSDGELSCTIRLFDCCDRTIHENASGWAALLRVQYDAAQPTTGMRNGTEDPQRAVRPDLVIFLGSARINLEAKRLGLRDALPTRYVREGMARFVNDRYISGPGEPGVMVGYVFSDPPTDVLAAVNEVVHEELGPDHVLKSPREPKPKILHHDSYHSEHVRLLHHTVDLR
jgi:hypothetical protein